MPLKALGLAALFLIAGQTVDPGDALRKSFERKAPNNVDAIVEQNSPGGNGSMRLRMWRDSQGRRRTEVLYPLAMQGRIFVDDGTTWKTYFPDSKTVRLHPSPSLEPDDLDFRMALIRRNYRLEVDEKTTVAGRQAIRLVAHPLRSADLPTQRFYLDAFTFTPLKVETVDDLGNVSVQFVVRKISYPGRFDKNVFDLNAPDGARVDKGHPPTPVQNWTDVNTRIGFRPAMPRRLPLGFRMRGKSDLLDWHDVTPLATKVTDGLVRLSVFQFRLGGQAPRPPKPGGEPQVGKTIGDIRVEVRGEAPVAVRERVLAPFVEILSKRTGAEVP
jgi:outer membrane lipoprotein-sorting protein